MKRAGDLPARGSNPANQGGNGAYNWIGRTRLRLLRTEENLKLLSKNKTILIGPTKPRTARGDFKISAQLCLIRVSLSSQMFGPFVLFCTPSLFLFPALLCFSGKGFCACSYKFDNGYWIAVGCVLGSGFGDRRFLH